MPKTAMISVIIPVYRCENYIGDCIESVLAQTYSQFELILVDDGSPDGAPAICDQYASKDNRIRVIHKENGGVSSARNAGIGTAQGEYLIFIDSDDYVDPRYLQAHLEIAEQTGADLVASGLVMETWEGRQITGQEVYSFPEFQKYDSKTLLEVWGMAFQPICMCGPCCKLYKRQIVSQKKIIFATDLNCGEDTLFNLQYLENCKLICTVPVNHYHYRRENGESLFSRFHKDTYEIHRRIYSRQYEIMVELGCSERGLRNFYCQYYTMMIGGIHEYYRHFEKTSRAEKKQLVNKIATDPYITRMKMRQIPGVKNKIFLLLLKTRQSGILLRLFDRHYQK